MYIIVTKGENPDLYLVENGDRERTELLRALGVTEFRSWFVTDSEVEAVKQNKFAVVQL